MVPEESHPLASATVFRRPGWVRSSAPSAHRSLDLVEDLEVRHAVKTQGARAQVQETLVSPLAGASHNRTLASQTLEVREWGWPVHWGSNHSIPTTGLQPRHFPGRGELRCLVRVGRPLLTEDLSEPEGTSFER